MIIALSGKYGSGKDLSVKYLVDEGIMGSGKTWQHLKFAAGLKSVVATLTNTTIEENYSDEGKAKHIEEFGRSLGKMQQDVGTILRQHLHPDVWVIPILKQHHAANVAFTIISDCRFKNEARMIKEAGGKIIRLNRKASANVKDGRDPNHISETDLDDYDGFDLIIDNNGTKEELRDQLLNFLASFYNT